MAENENGEEKTEKATPKRLREARKKGQVAKSNDIVSVAFMLGAFAVLKLCAKFSYHQITGCIEYWLDLCGKGLGADKTIDGDIMYQTVFLNFIKTVVLAAGPVMICGLLFTVVATGIQTRFLFSVESIKFKMEKLNPLKGIKRMFSLKALFELGKSLLKFFAIGAVLVIRFRDSMYEFARLFDMEPITAFVYIASSIFDIVMQVCIIFTAIAALDFLFQKFSFDNDMKMTKQEVKDEYKNTEGDPKIKGRRRQKQMELHNLMMQDVKHSDVVVRNPTHYAVALKYDPDAGDAPVVTAKGADNVAFRIIKEAEDAGVPLVENRPLARALYEKAELSRPIPFEFYQEVAQVLIFVYDLQKKAPPVSKNKKTEQRSPDAKSASTV